MQEGLPGSPHTHGILVAGGGFAGMWAALAARRELVLAGHEHVAVSLVTPDPMLTVRPRLYEKDPDAWQTGLRPTLDAAGVELIIGWVASIDHATRRCVLEDGRRPGYARLVLATGSRVRALEVPGAERSLDIDTHAGAVAFDERLRALAHVRRRDAAVAIIGAGFTGIELATALRVRVDALGADMRILLIDRAGVAGASLGEGPRTEIERALTHANVVCHLASGLARIGPETLELTNGGHLRAHLVVNCTGLVASPLTMGLPAPRDAHGRLEVDDDLRVSGLPEIYAAGDVAAARVDEAGNRSLMSCQHALTMGRFAGYNAARDLVGLPGAPYRQTRYVTCLDLGAAGAVFTEGRQRRVTAAGERAASIKRHINSVLIYPPVGSTTEVLASAALPEPDAR